MKGFGGCLALGLLAATTLRGPSVTPGLDVLREDGSLLAGKRVGLITNHTGVALDGTPAVQVLQDLGLSVVALFAPEHGYRGDVAAGEPVASRGADASAPPVLSLYGETRQPTDEMLSGIDVLVFDIQDVGVRFYTYVSTMKLAMEAAARNNIEFLVLDRPNPNGGERVEGPILDPEFRSFVGISEIPLLHGMTVGELANLFKRTMPGGEVLRLTVVPVRGWKREMLWGDTGLPWRPPSPNLRTVTSALAYPAFGLLEGINVSEGRGVDETFERAGAPWIDRALLSESMRGRSLRGVRFEPTSFVPRDIPAAPEPKYRDETCHGVKLLIDEPRNFEAVRTGLSAIATIRDLFPQSFSWVRRGDGYWLDRLLGTDRPRQSIEAGVGVDEIVSRERPRVEAFRRLRATCLLY
ncbi:MAG TPA: DUF1343 domain-containing protein [Vicinamibacteria bacterium]|nr:DUF1343 domain-containing protein [Vicinamibacteria bacterium]